MTSPSLAEALRLDVRLVEGFRFECRPDCGLCCYASPAITEAETTHLLSIAPSFRPAGDPPGFIPSRPEGGACVFLAHQRCTIHEARPGPCAQYPLSVHLADRIQVSVVLSCPGVSLSSLLPNKSGRPPTGTGVDASLGGEFSAAARAAACVTASELAQAGRTWRRALGVRPDDPIEGRIVTDAIVAELHDSLPMPAADDLAAVPLPEGSEGLERLPLFFDPRFGRVAICAGDEGVDLLALREGGGVEERLASFAYPEHVPRLTKGADERLRAYLGYMLDRDAFLGAALERFDRRDEITLLELCTEDLREIAAATLGRAVYRCWLHGGSGETLDTEEIDDGIRATDADYLDRPTAGRWL